MNHMSDAGPSSFNILNFFYLQNPFVVMFEKGSLTAMRFVTALDMDHPELTESLSRELWMRAWSRVKHILKFCTLCRDN